MNEWTENLFVKKGNLFLKLMNRKWEKAERTVNAIEKILKKNGIEKGKILDLMCGNGRIAIYLAKKGYDVVGLDLSPIFIEDAKERVEEFGVEDKVKFMKEDVRRLEKIGFENEFDCILNVWTSIGYFGKKTDEKMFRNLRDLSKKNGIFGIFECASREYLLNKFSPMVIDKIEDLILIQKNNFNLLTSTVESTWEFYKKEERDLKHIEDFVITHYLYSISELVYLLENTGWRVDELYRDLENLKSFQPDKLRKSIKDTKINLIAKKKA